MSTLPQDQRKAYMGLLARSAPRSLAELLPDLPDHVWLRAPEIGTTMVRGRVGGTGAPFNLGEITVTRCALQLPDGRVGHAYVQGRDKAHATRAAVVDALMQGDEAAQIRASVVTPLQAQEAACRQTRTEKAAATKVEFFTMVRGED